MMLRHERRFCAGLTTAGVGLAATAGAQPPPPPGLPPGGPGFGLLRGGPGGLWHP